MKAFIANAEKRVTALYDRCMRFMLSFEWLQVYYHDRSTVIDKLSDKYYHLTDTQKADAITHGLANIDDIDINKVRLIATKLIRRHATRAAIVTFIATLPQNWVMWPLFVVDIVFFQKEIFLVTQELEVLYGGCLTSDYSALASTAVKMGGVALKSKVTGYIKRTLGFSLRKTIEYCARIFRTSIRAAIASAAKWAGIAAERHAIDLAINIIVYILTAAIAGAISYWLFIPMARRFERQLSNNL